MDVFFSAQGYTVFEAIFIAHGRMFGLLLKKFIGALAAFFGRSGGAMVMATGSTAQPTFEEVYTDTIAQLEKLQRRQERVLELLRDAVSRNKGMEDIKKQIDEI